MKFLHAIVLASSSVAGLGVLGCDVMVSSRRPEPVYVEQQPAYVIVAEAPPAPQIVEQRPPPPAPGYLWIDGYYAWSGRQYVWESGRWAVPPSGYAIWVAPRYEREQRGVRYTSGHWQRHEGARDQQPDRH